MASPQCLFAFMVLGRREHRRVGLWSKVGVRTAVGDSAQLYASTWNGDQHEGTRQGDRGCERSSHWRPPRQPLAPEVVLRASGPLRPLCGKKTRKY